MGILGKIGSLFDSAKCATGFHDWSSWSVKQPDSCLQTHKCKRCDKEQNSVNHSWLDWSYLEPGTCAQKRECSHCSDFDYRKEHVWDVWKYVSPKSCDQIRFCRRCSEKDYHIADHDDHQWSESKRVACDKLSQKCERCRIDNTIAIYSPSDYQHKFGPWRRISVSRMQRICKECEAEELKWID